MAESVGRLEASFHIDLRPLRRGLRTASGMLRKWAATNETNAEVGVDLDPLRSGLKQASGMLQSFDGKSATANLRVNLTGLQQGLREGSRRLSEFDGKKAEAKVTADTSSATRSFNSLRRQLADLSRESGNISVSADTTQARDAIRNLVRWASRQEAAIRAGADTGGGRRSVTGFVDWADRQSASASVGAATQDARGSVNSLLRWIAAQSANVSVGAATKDARQSVEALKRRIEAMQASIRVTANTDPAMQRVQTLRDSIRDKKAPLTIEPRIEDAKKKINEFLTWIRQQRADITVGAVVGDAQRAADSMRTYIGNLSANIDVGANTGAAIAEGRLATGRIDKMSGDINVGSDTAAAYPPVQGIVNRINNSRGDVKVGADTGGARTELAGFNQVVQRYSRSWGTQGLRVRVQSDITQAAAQLRNLERIARSVTDPEYKVRVDAQVLRARGQLHALGVIADGLGMKRPTISVGVRGVAASAAQMLGLYALADRLDGYNIKIGASVDDNISRAIPAMLGDLGQQLARFKSIATVTAAVAVPAFYTALSTLPAVISMAATAAGAFATRLGAGVVGALGSVASAAVLGGGALGVYGLALRKTAQYAFNLGGMLKDQKDRVDDATDGVKMAKAAVESATPGTREYANAVKGVTLAEQNLAYETKKFNAILEATTPAMMKMNKEAGNLHVEFIRLGGAVANKTAPVMTKWIQGLTRLLPTVRPHILDMVGDMNKVADSFVKTMSKGRELENLKTIFSGIKSAGVPMLTTLTSSARLFVNVFSAMVPSGLKVLNVMSRATTAAAKWSGSAEGQKRIGTVWGMLATAGAQLWRIIRDLGAGFGGLIVALNATGIGQGMMNGLEGIAAGFRNVMREGGRGRKVIAEFGTYTSPVLSAIADLVKGVATQFGLMAVEVGKSGLMVDVVNAFNDALLGTKDGQGIIKMLRHEFEVIGPLLPPLITALGNWFSVFAQSEPEMIFFIKSFTQILELFNSLPEPIKRGIARTIAWTSAIKALSGGSGLTGLLGTMAQTSTQLAVMQTAMGTHASLWAAYKAQVVGAAAAVKGAAIATMTWVRAQTAAAIAAVRVRVAIVAQKVAMLASVVATKAMIVAQRALNLAMRMNPIGLVITAAALLAAGLVMLYRRSETFRNIVNTLGNVLKTVVVVAFRGLVAAAKAVWQWFSKLPAPIQFLISPLGALVNAGRAVIRNWSEIKAKGLAVWQVLRAAVVASVRGIAAGAVAAWQVLKAGTLAAFRATVAGVRAAWSALRGFVVAVARGIADGVRAAWNLLKTVTIAAFRATVNGARAVWNGLKSLVISVARAAANGAKAAWNLLKTVTVTAFRAAVNGARAVWNTLKTVVVAVARAVANGVKASWNAIKSVTSSVFNAVRSVAKSVWNGIRSVILGVAKAISSGVRSAWNGLTSITRSAFNAIRSVSQSVWNGIKSLILGVVKAIASGAKSAWNGLKNATSSAWNAIKSVTSKVWNGIKSFMTSIWKALKGIFDSALRAIGNRVDSWAKAVRNTFSSLGKWAQGYWKSFWSGLKSLWDSSLAAIGNRTEKWRDALRRLMDAIAKAVRKRWDDFWSGLKNLWDRSFTAIGNRTEKWRDALRRLMDAIAKAVRKRWDNFWSGLKGLWDRSFTAIGNRTEKWRDALRNLMDAIAKKVRSRWDSFWSGFRGLWDRSLSAVGERLRSWGDATRKLFGNMVDAARKFGDNIKNALVNKISSAVNKVRKWLGGLAIALANVLGALGMKGPAGGLRSRGQKLKAPLKMAKGGTTTVQHGVVHEYGTGGIADGKMPHAVYGEVGKKESYTVHGRRDNLPYAEQYLRSVGHTAVPNGARNDGKRQHLPAKEPPDAFAKGGMRGVPQSVPHYAVGGIGGSMDKAVMSRFRTGHFSGPSHRGNGSVDFNPGRWGSPARGNVLKEGSKIANFLVQSAKKFRLQNVVWQNKINTGGGFKGHGRSGVTKGHYDHVHSGYDGGNLAGGGGAFNGSGSKGSGGGGGFSGVKDFLGRAYNSVKDFVTKKFKPPKIPKLGLGSFGAGLTGGLSKTVLGGARKYVTKLAKDKLSMGDSGGGGVSGNFSGGQKEMALTFAKNAKRRGMPGRLPVMTALQESGMRNLKGGDRDSVGYFQQRGNGAWGPLSKRRSASGSLSSFLDAAQKYKGQYGNNPKGLGAWAQRVQASAHPGAYSKHWDTAANLIGDKKYYGSGGVIPGATGEPKLLMAHAGERVLPADLNRGFESLAHSIEIWSARGASGPAANGFSSSGVEKRLERLERALIEKLDNVNLAERTVERQIVVADRVSENVMSSKRGENIVQTHNNRIQTRSRIKGRG